MPGNDAVTVLRRMEERAAGFRASLGEPQRELCLAFLARTVELNKEHLAGVGSPPRIVRVVTALHHEIVHVGGGVDRGIEVAFHSRILPPKGDTLTLISLVIGAIAALIFYAVATALVTFAHSALIFGLVALLIFLALAFGGRTRVP